MRATLPAVLRLLAIRHGETDWNRERRWQGWIDRPLLPGSVAQARERAEWMAAHEIRPALICSSDLLRARQTAEAIGEVLGITPTVDPDLRERHGGALEGLDPDGIERELPGFLDAWRAGTLDAPPGGESDDDVFERVMRGIARLHAAASLARPAIVVTHGGVLRILAQRAGEPAKGTPNLGGRWFDLDDGRLIAGPLVDPLPTPTDRAIHQVE
jgi:broad specificity phosphatase PhoE